MKIELINRLSGEERYGTCSECGVTAEEGKSIYRINTETTSVCICLKHMRTLRGKIFYMNEV